MAATEFTFDKFIEKLKSNQYETSTAAKRGVGKVLWSTAKKDEARALIDKHFGDGSKAPKAAKPVKAAKVAKAPKVADKPKGKPGRKPKTETVEAAPKVKGKPGPKPGAKKAEKPAKVVAPAAEPKKRGRPAGSGKKALTAPTAAKAVLAELNEVGPSEDGLSDYTLKLLELAIEEQNALSNILLAVPSAKEAFSINPEEIQSNIDLYAQLTRRIDSILGPALDALVAPPAVKTAGPRPVEGPVEAKAPKAPKAKAAKIVEETVDLVPVAGEGDDDHDEDPDAPLPIEALSSNGASEAEEARRSALWSGALPIAQSLDLRGLLAPEQFE